MNQLLKPKSILINCFFLVLSCGVNTETATTPYIFLIPIAAPQILSVIPVNSNISDTLTYNTEFNSSPKPEYLVRYYVTNSEPQFVGYNLYITSTIPSVAETGAGGSIYLENGVQPSFPHSPAEASTEKVNLKVQRIENRIPPPGVTPFQSCEIYTFTMRAVTNMEITSNQSTPVSKCASNNPSLCEIGSSCNPSSCSVSTCTDKNACAVGTICNPCLIQGQESLGCVCPEGTSPPGCNI